MKKRTVLGISLIGMVVLLLCSTPVRAGAISEKRKAQNKLLAYRAARVDAIRKLAERIRGLHITSQTTVNDFVASSDTIRTAMRAYLNGMREVGKPRYLEDGTCEVRMEVTLKEIIATLKRFHRTYYKGSKIRVEDFDKMTVTNNIKVISVTGSGAPRPELEEPEIQPVRGGDLMSITHLTGKAKAYWKAHCTGRGRLMAVRAARVDALRKLGERIGGVLITSTTSVRDFVAESDQVNVDMRTFIRGAREVGIYYHPDELIVEVKMAVKLRDVLITLKQWAVKHYRGDKVNITHLEKMIVETRDKVITETGMGVPPEKYLKEVPPAVEAVMRLAARAPDWTARTLRVVGSAAIDTDNPNKAQAKLMAFRAAELDARRKLAERIDGLMITSNTSVRDFVAQNDEIETSMLTFQQGAHVVEGSQKILPDGTAQVTVEIDLKPLWRMILYYQKKLSITIK